MNKVKRILYTIVALWATTLSIAAATAEDFNNAIYTKDASVLPGRTITLPIYLKNEEYAVKSFQFTIELPQGVSFVSTDDGYQRTLLPTGWTSTADTKTGQPANTALVMGYYVSGNDLSIPQSDETLVMTLTLQVADDAELGDKQITICNQKLTDGSGRGHSDNTLSLASQLKVRLLGDVNGDGVVNTTDAVIVINHYLGKTTLENPEIADINNDNDINTTDAVLILKDYLNK